MLVVRIVDGDPFHHVRVEVLQIRQLGFVELLENARGDLALQERGRGHDNVIVRMTGQHLGFEDLVRIEHIVVDLDAGLLREVRQHGGVDVV